MVDFFRYLIDTNLVTAAFVFGALAFVVAVIGRINTIIDPPPVTRVILALFGVLLIALSFASHFIANQSQLSTNEAVAQTPTTTFVEPVSHSTPQIAPTAIDAAQSVADSQHEVAIQSEPEPLRDHFPVSVGEGILAEGTFSDGLAPYSEQWLWDNDRFHVQRIRPEEHPDGCDVIRYESNLIWISGSRGMTLLINGNHVGTYTSDADVHGYMFAYPVHLGDTICAANFSSSIGFSIVTGPDVYYHYDSYCYRGNCP